MENQMNLVDRVAMFGLTEREKDDLIELVNYLRKFSEENTQIKIDGYKTTLLSKIIPRLNDSYEKKVSQKNKVIEAIDAALTADKLEDYLDLFRKMEEIKNKNQVNYYNFSSERQEKKPDNYPQFTSSSAEVILSINLDTNESIKNDYSYIKKLYVTENEYSNTKILLEKIPVYNVLGDSIDFCKEFNEMKEIKDKIENLKKLKDSKIQFIDEIEHLKKLVSKKIEIQMSDNLKTTLDNIETLLNDKLYKVIIILGPDFEKCLNKINKIKEKKVLTESDIATILSTIYHMKDWAESDLHNNKEPMRSENSETISTNIMKYLKDFIDETKLYNLIEEGLKTILKERIEKFKSKLETIDYREKHDIIINQLEKNLDTASKNTDEKARIIKKLEKPNPIINLIHEDTSKKIIESLNNNNIRGFGKIIADFENILMLDGYDMDDEIEEKVPKRNSL